MKFALFYKDNQKFITAREKGGDAVALARGLSQETGKDITVFYNGPRGDTDVCCHCRGDAVDVIGGHCLGPLQRWIVGLLRRLKAAS